MAGFICCCQPIDDFLLVSMRMFKSQPTDHPDHHETNQNNDNTFDLFSMGPDGQSNSDDDIWPEGMGGD